MTAYKMLTSNKMSCVRKYNDMIYNNIIKLSRTERKL